MGTRSWLGTCPISWDPQLLAQGCLNFGETEEGEEGRGPGPGQLAVTAGSDLALQSHSPIHPSGIPHRGRLVLHKTGRGRPGVAEASDARTPCPRGCRQDGQGRPQPGFLCAECTGQKGEVGCMVTGRYGQHPPLPSPTVPPALSESGALSSNPTSAISQLNDFGERSSQGLSQLPLGSLTSKPPSHFGASSSSSLFHGKTGLKTNCVLETQR